MENNSNNLKQANGSVTDNIANNEIDLRELFTVIWQGKLIVIALTTLFAVASVFYAISLPNVYKSEALLAPAEAQQQGGLGALASQFGGLASLAGGSLGSGSINKAQLALEVIKSRQFAANFIKKHKILPDLMAINEWQHKNNTITYDDELYDKANDKWVREVKAPYQSKPSMQEAFSVFGEVMRANADEKTGMFIISVEHQSPFIAKQWVSWLIEDINLEMKTRDVEEANRSTEFLMRQLKQTQVADIRTVLYNLIEEQAKTIMFANVRDEYVFKTIDPAIVPEKKSAPQRALICILGALLGGFFGVIIVLIRFYIPKSK